jgi:hypothetical protein
MKNSSLVGIVNSIAQKYDNLITFDVLKEIALNLYDIGIIAVPFVLERDEKSGKISKTPRGKWSRLKGTVSKEELDQYWEETVASPKWLKQYKEGKVKLSETTRNFAREQRTTGIGILTGQISKITVLDIDDEEKFLTSTGIKREEFEKLLKSTVAVKTPSGGYHIYFQYDSDLKQTTKQGQGYDIRNDGGLIVIPPSRVWHEKEPIYSFIGTEQIAEIPGWLKENLIERRDKKEREQKEERPEKTLRERVIEEIVNLLEPVYVPGYRHNLVVSLIGFLYKNRFGKDVAEKIVGKLAEITDDEEIGNRLYQVWWHYDGGRFKELEERGIKPKGISGIAEVLDFQIEEGRIDESYKYLVLEKLQTLTRSTELEHLFVSTGKKGYANLGERKQIVEWRKNREKKFEIQEVVTNFSITEIKRFIDVVKNEEDVYIVKGITRDGQSIELKGTIPEIVKAIIKKGLEATDPKKVKIAISTLIVEAKVKGLVGEEKGLNAIGFAIDPDTKELIANIPDWREGKSYSKEDVKKALQYLNEYVDKFCSAKRSQVAEVLKFSVAAPFFFGRKQLGKEPWQWLWIVGDRSTGKTTDAELGLSIWGVKLYRRGNLQDVATAPRLAKKVSSTTFQLILNEVGKLFNDEEGRYDDIREFLKDIWDNVVARQTLTRSGEPITAYALSPLIFTSNVPPNLELPETKRIKVISYPLSASVHGKDKEKQRKEFQEWKTKAEPYLSLLGREIYKLVKENPEWIEESRSYEEFGRTVLTELYKAHFGSAPDWVKLTAIEEKVNERDENPEMEKTEILNSILAVLIDKAKKGNPRKFDETLKVGLIRPLLKDALKADIKLPVAFYETGDAEVYNYIAIRHSILPVLKQYGVEIPTLSSLAEKTGAKIEKITIRERGWIGVKAVLIPEPEFNNLLSIYKDEKTTVAFEEEGYTPDLEDIEPEEIGL